MIFGNFPAYVQGICSMYIWDLKKRLFTVYKLDQCMYVLLILD